MSLLSDLCQQRVSKISSHVACLYIDKHAQHTQQITLLKEYRDSIYIRGVCTLLYQRMQVQRMTGLRSVNCTGTSVFRYDNHQGRNNRVYYESTQNGENSES